MNNSSTVYNTVVEAMCISKKEKKNWDTNHPKAWEIEVEVPYDQSSIDWKMSGSTYLSLNTCNEAAANMFVIGEKYMVSITPVGQPSKEEA